MQAHVEKLSRQSIDSVWPQCLIVYIGVIFHLSKPMLFEVDYDGHIFHIHQPKHEGTDKNRHKTLVKYALTTLLQNVNNTRKKKY